MPFYQAESMAPTLHRNAVTHVKVLDEWFQVVYLRTNKNITSFKLKKDLRQIIAPYYFHRVMSDCGGVAPEYCRDMCCNEYVNYYSDFFARIGISTIYAVLTSNDKHIAEKYGFVETFSRKSSRGHAYDIVSMQKTVAWDSPNLFVGYPGWDSAKFMYGKLECKSEGEVVVHG